MCFKPLQPLTFSFNSFKQLEENCSSRLDHLFFTVKMKAEGTKKYSILFIHLLTTLIENICFYCKHSTDHKIKQQTPEICIVKKKLRYIEWVFTMEMGIKIKAILHQKLCIFTLYTQHFIKYFIMYLRPTNFLICKRIFWERSEHRI